MLSDLNIESNADVRFEKRGSRGWWIREQTSGCALDLIRESVVGVRVEEQLQVVEQEVDGGGMEWNMV